MSRTLNAFRNARAGILSKILYLVFGFCSRTLFIYLLGNTYLGVNGLYTEILSLLSFAELGFGSALTFAMYRPVAEDDHEKIVMLLDFYKKVYRAIAMVIAICGICLLPFLQYIVKGADWLTLWELRLYFLIFLFNTVVSYFVSYKYSYLNALQKNYIQTNIEAVANTVCQIAQMAVIIIFRSFLLYLLVNSLFLLASRFAAACYLNRRFPILKERPAAALDKGTKQVIYREVRGLAVHQFAGVAVHSTDNILISAISGMGVVAVGYISNYNMLINAVLGFVTIAFGSVASAFGNLVASGETEGYHKAFQEINFLSFWVYGFCAISFWLLIPPFITLWIGADKLVDSVSFTLIVVNCYMQGQSTVYNNARIAKGDFGKDRLWAFLQAAVNLVVSVVAAKFLGLVGIYIGTVASRMVYVIFRPFSTYQFLFGKPPMEYYKKFFAYFLATVFTAAVVSFLTKGLLVNVTAASFLIAAILVVAFVNLIFFLLFFRTSEFQGCMARLRRGAKKA